MAVLLDGREVDGREVDGREGDGREGDGREGARCRRVGAGDDSCGGRRAASSTGRSTYH